MLKCPATRNSPAVFKGTLNTLGILIMFLHTRQTEYMSTSHLTRIYHLKILRKTESTLLRLTHLCSYGRDLCQKVFFTWIIPLHNKRSRQVFNPPHIKTHINNDTTIVTKVYNVILFFVQTSGEHGFTSDVLVKSFLTGLDHTQLFSRLYSLL